MSLQPIPLPYPPLSDGDLVLRAWRDADLPHIVAACADPEIPRWTPIPDPYELHHAEEWMLTHEPIRMAGMGLLLAIADARQPSRLLGSIGLQDVDWRHAAGEVGYWVAPWARRRRVATRALILLSDWALGPLGMHRIALLADVKNVPSQRVAEGAGYVREGVLRSARDHRGVRGDFVLYARLRTDPPPPHPLPAVPARRPG